MNDVTPNERMRKSVENLVKAGGRVVTVRLTPASNLSLTKMMEAEPGSTTTQWVNFVLENFQFTEKKSELP